MKLSVPAAPGPVAGQQVGNEVPDDGAGPAGTACNHAGREDVRLAVPHHVDRAALLAGAVELEPPGMASRRLHLVQAKPEFLEPLIVSDRFAQAPAVRANRRDDDLHGRWQMADGRGRWEMNCSQT